MIVNCWSIFSDMTCLTRKPICNCLKYFRTLSSFQLCSKCCQGHLCDNFTFSSGTKEQIPMTWFLMWISVCFTLLPNFYLRWCWKKNWMTTKTWILGTHRIENFYLVNWSLSVWLRWKIVLQCSPRWLITCSFNADLLHQTVALLLVWNEYTL